MKPPTPASLKKVNVENLAALGAERLAAILVAVADARPEVKRRLRMELAAEQGAEHLWVEIDKRLTSLRTSRSKVSWRQRPTFVRDLEALRVLTAERLAALDPPAAFDRLLQFMGLSRRLASRVRDRDGELAAVFARAAADIGALAVQLDGDRAAHGLVNAIVAEPQQASQWLPTLLAAASPALAETALRQISHMDGAINAWLPAIRQLADAAADADAFAATFTAAARATPAPAAQIAQRLLAAGRAQEAGEVLNAGRATSRTSDPDFDWETAWIDYLDQSGQAPEAQALRWASFERTLSVDRARAFTQRLADFEDVEAEARAFAIAAQHTDAPRALGFLMDWPALGEAGRLIQARADELQPSPEQAELWAAKLQQRHPAAAALLLRQAAAAASRRREFKARDRLTAQADAISG